MSGPLPPPTSTADDVAAPAAPAAPAARQRLPFWMGLFLVLAVGLAYGGALQTAFVFDDEWYILDEPGLRSRQGLVSLLGRTTRPVVYATLAVNYWTAGPKPWDYKATNVVVHMLATLVLFGLVRRTLLLCGPAWRDTAAWAALGAALLWALHPLSTQSVTYVWQRCESLMGLFFLGTIYAFVRASRGGLLWAAAAVGCCLLGMGTKEVMVTAPILTLLYDRTFLAGSFRQALRARWPIHLGLAGTWIALALLLATAGAYHENPGVGFRSNVFTPASYANAQLYALALYAGRALWPAQLVFDAHWPPAVAPALFRLHQAATIALVVGTVWLLWRRSRWGFAGAWFFLILAPTSSVMPMPDPVVEHRVYLPLAGLAAAVSAGLYALLGRAAGPHRGKLAATLVVALLGTLLAFATAARNRVYASQRALWADTVRKDPANPRARCNLGRAYIQQYDATQNVRLLDRARAHVREALRLQPANYDARINLGTIAGRCGAYERAADHFRAALRLDPPHPEEALFNLANAYMDLGRTQSAEETFERVLEADPHHDEAHNSLGVLYATSGTPDRAAAHFRAALRLNPRHPTAQQNLKRLQDASTR